MLQLHVRRYSAEKIQCTNQWAYQKKVWRRNTGKAGIAVQMWLISGKMSSRIGVCFGHLLWASSTSPLARTSITPLARPSIAPIHGYLSQPPGSRPRHGMVSEDDEMLHQRQPLSGINVVDFGHFIAGPLTARCEPFALCDHYLSQLPSKISLQPADRKSRTARLKETPPHGTQQ